jgi:hypothetical protein
VILAMQAFDAGRRMVFDSQKREIHAG